MTTATAKKTAPTKAAKPAPKSANKPAAKTVAKAAPKPMKPAGAKTEVKVEAKATSTPTAGGTLRARDLVARVAEATGAKVKDIKATVEATLSQIGRALDAGEALNLPPLGKVKITPAKAEGGAGAMKLKLRRGAGTAPKKKAEKEALAEGGEDS